jgi:hypothetical protein
MTRSRARAAQRWLSAYLHAAPGTHVYLLILLVTTTTVRSLHPALAEQLLRQLSTNLTQMGRSAGRVLVLSAFLLDGGRWLTQVVLFTAVYVPLERWVGTARWFLIVAAGHVGATLVTTVGIWADVRSNRGGLALSRSIDVGTSYGFFAAAGFLVFAFRSVALRVVYGVGLGGFLGYQMARTHTFTDAGHVAAVVIGAALFLLLGPGVRARERTTTATAGPRPSAALSRTAP